MLPQLATATFPSQIFWVVLGFFLVYGIMAFFAVPRLKKILSDRQLYVDNLLEIAKRFNEKSEMLENEAENSFMSVKQEILNAEVKLVEELERRCSEERERISKEIFESANREMSALKISSEEVFNEVSFDLDELTDIALQKVGSKKS